jgi:hypothetical protein
MDDIRRSERGGNTAYLNLGVWYEAATGQIHMTLPHSGWFHTTVSTDPKSIRFHRSLVEQLTRAMKEAGVPYPEVSRTEDV